MAFTSQSKAPKQHVLELCSTALALRLHPGTLVYRQDQGTPFPALPLCGDCSLRVPCLTRVLPSHSPMPTPQSPTRTPCTSC